jgi:hypothetical protein
MLRSLAAGIAGRVQILRLVTSTVTTHQSQFVDADIGGKGGFLPEMLL